MSMVFRLLLLTCIALAGCTVEPDGEGEPTLRECPDEVRVRRDGAVADGDQGASGPHVHPDGGFCKISPLPAYDPSSTHLEVTRIYNDLGFDGEVRFQAYRLTEGGVQVLDYPIKVVRIRDAGTNMLGPDSFPTCDARMAGIVIRTFDAGGNMVHNNQWSGIHCMGPSARYFVRIADDGLRFGDFE